MSPRQFYVSIGRQAVMTLRLRFASHFVSESSPMLIAAFLASKAGTPPVVSFWLCVLDAKARRILLCQLQKQEPKIRLSWLGSKSSAL